MKVWKKDVALYRISILFFVVSTLLFYFKLTDRPLGSDTLYLNQVANDILSGKGHWKDWNFAPAPDFFPDMFLYFIAYYIAPLAETRLYLVVVFQSIISLLAILALARAIDEKISLLSRSLIILFWAFFNIVCLNSGIYFYINTSNGHFSAFLFPIICLCLYIRNFNSHWKVLAALIFLINVLALLSSKIYLLVFLIPFFIFLLVKAAYFWKARNWLLVKRSIWLMVANVISLVAFSKLLRLVVPVDALGNRLPFTESAARNSINFILETFRNSFSFDNGYTFSLSLAIAVSMIFSGWFASSILSAKLVRLNASSADIFQTPSITYGTFACFAFLSLLVTLSGLISSGAYIDPQGFRYLVFPFALFVLLTLLFLGRHINKRQFGVPGAIGVIVLVGLSSFASYAHTLLHRRPVVSNLVRCLTGLEQGGLDIQSGVTHYAFAASASYYQGPRHFLIAIDTDATPLSWMSTKGPVTRPDAYGYHYNFLVFPEKGDPYFPYFNAIKLGHYFPHPSNVLRCPSGKFEIWYYADTTLNTAMRQAFSRASFMNGRGSEYEVGAFTLPGSIGQISGTDRIAREGIDPKGFLSFGPYVDLTQQTYTVSANYSATGDISESYIDVVARDGDHPNGEMLARQDLSDHRVGPFQTTIIAPPAGLKNLEIRVWFGGKGQLTMHDVSIRRN